MYQQLKNYLNESGLNNLTNLFLDYAEDMAEEENIMTMQNRIDTPDKLLKFRKKKILNDSGKISHKRAVEKARSLSKGFHKLIKKYKNDKIL